MEKERLACRALVRATMMLILGALATAAEAQVDILTNRYDGARTGANLGEKALTPANVNANQFGKLYSYPVDGAVYAQPLYVAGLTINGAVRNVLYVATMNDKVYAFDADSTSPTPLWLADFTAAGVTPVPMTDIVNPSLNIYGNVGIESTPVIDREAATLYLVARTKENGSYFQRLHALDILTGRERPGSPVEIAGSVPGNALDSTLEGAARVITFDPKMHQQRAGLALTNGVVLVTWAGHEDRPPYHGWIMGFDATTLATVGVFAAAADDYGGGVWQGGRAPTLDAAGNAYIATGNGKWDGLRNWGDSLLKFAVTRSGLTLADYFTPGNEATLNINDDDLSGSGFTLLPGTNLLLGGGKEGVLYLLNKDNLGRKVSGDTQIVQRIAVNGGHVMGGPVYWDSADTGPLVYNWGEDDVLVSYRLINGKLSPVYAQGQVRSPGHPGGSLTLSANGSVSSTGIVWASIPTSRSAKHSLVAGTLRAYNAETLQEIWTSDQNAARDRAGTIVKFVPPVVVNGKVYMANHDNAVLVYGLLPADFSVTATPAGMQIAAGSSATVSVAIGAYNGFNGRIDLSASGAPAGTTITFNPASLTGGGLATMTIAVPSSATATSFSVIATGTSGLLVHAAAVAVNPPATRKEIVLYAKNAEPIAGGWGLVADASAAGGARVELPDGGVAKLTTALANPENYFELSFAAEPNVPYRLWLRGRAQNNSYNNDSVYVQFSGSVTATGQPINRIGTTEAVVVVLEDCSGCGVAGWGWQDNGYGLNVLGPVLYFTEGVQTIRIQQREDGLAIDQIVLSAGTYFTGSPGLTKNDTTLLQMSVQTPTIVRYAATALTPHGAWRLVVDASAAGGSRMEQPNVGAPKITAPAVDPADYFELTFVAQANTPYRLWLRGKAQGNSYNNDSVYVQFSGSVTSSGLPINRIQSGEGVPVVLEDCAACPLSGWGWQDNGYGAGVLGPPLYFIAGPQTIRIQAREDGISIDQIVLSPDLYFTTAPGAVRNDNTILTKTP